MKFRDVYPGLQRLRYFLLGKKTPYLLRGRFNPLIAPRTIPPADIPRGPEYKYSNQYYFNRHAYDSVQPPVVGRVALGATPKSPVGVGESTTGSGPGVRIDFTSPPKPGLAYWWDSHCYFECIPDFTPPKKEPRPPPPEVPTRPPRRVEPKCLEEVDPCDPCQPPKTW